MVGSAHGPKTVSLESSAKDHLSWTMPMGDSKCMRARNMLMGCQHMGMEGLITFEGLGRAKCGKAASEQIEETWRK